MSPQELLSSLIKYTLLIAFVVGCKQESIQIVLSDEHTASAFSSKSEPFILLYFETLECGPCQEQLKLAKKLGVATGFQEVLVIAKSKNLKRLAFFLEEAEVDFDAVIDDDGVFQRENPLLFDHGYEAHLIQGNNRDEVVFSGHIEDLFDYVMRKSL